MHLFKPGLGGMVLPVNKMSRQVSLGFMIFLLLLTYDGALRKWLLPGSEQLVFVTKDILFLCLMLFVFVSRKNKAHVPDFVAYTLLFYALWVVGEMFNPGSPNFAVSIWGAKAHLLYAGLILLIPVMFYSTEDALGQMERLFAVIVIPVCVIATVQVDLDADSTLNQQVRGGLEGVSYFGEESLVRVAGTFSYISGMAAFVQFTALIGAGLFIAGCRSRGFLAGLAAVAAVIPVTGSRAVVYFVAVGTAIMIAAALRANLLRGRRLINVVGVTSVVLAISFFSQNDAWTALHQRMEANSDEGTPRIVSAFTNAFSHVAIAGVAGYGIGTAHAGAAGLSGGEEPFSWFPAGTGFEEESGRIVLELGVVGWLISLAMRVALLIWSIRLAFKGKTRPIRLIGVMALPFMGFGVHAGNGVFAASYMAVGYWFVAGLMAVAQRDSWRCRRQSSFPLNRDVLS